MAPETPEPWHEFLSSFVCQCGKVAFLNSFLHSQPLLVHRTEVWADTAETTYGRTATLELWSVIVPNCPHPSQLYHKTAPWCIGHLTPKTEHKQLVPALGLLASWLSLPRVQLTKEFPQLQLRQTLKWNWLEVRYVPPCSCVLPLVIAMVRARIPDEPLATLSSTTVLISLQSLPSAWLLLPSKMGWFRFQKQSVTPAHPAMNLD